MLSCEKVEEFIESTGDKNVDEGSDEKHQYSTGIKKHHGPCLQGREMKTNFSEVLIEFMNLVNRMKQKQSMYRIFMTISLY